MTAPPPPRALGGTSGFPPGYTPLGGLLRKESPMSGEYMWLLPAWLIGMPFVFGLIEYFRTSRQVGHM